MKPPPPPANINGPHCLRIVQWEYGNYFGFGDFPYSFQKPSINRIRQNKYNNTDKQLLLHRGKMQGRQAKRLDPIG